MRAPRRPSIGRGGLGALIALDATARRSRPRARSCTTPAHSASSWSWTSATVRPRWSTATRRAPRSPRRPASRSSRPTPRCPSHRSRCRGPADARHRDRHRRRDRGARRAARDDRPPRGLRARGRARLRRPRPSPRRSSRRATRSCRSRSPPRRRARGARRRRRPVRARCWSAPRSRRTSRPCAGSISRRSRRARFEAEIVDALRAAGDHVPELCLVASSTTVRSPATSCSAEPDRSRRSPGARPRPDRRRSRAPERRHRHGADVRRDRTRDERTDYPLIALLGHPGYYPRFGFRPAAATFGITKHYEAPPEAWMALALPAYEPHIRGALPLRGRLRLTRAVRARLRAVPAHAHRAPGARVVA